MKKLMFLLVFFALSITTALAQKTFSGKVIGPDGLGLPGVSVVEKANPINGISTDIDGNWTLTVPNGNTILEFTSIGMKPIKIAAKDAANLTMVADAQMLDDVIVVAFGKAKKSAFTGSAVQLDSKELEKRQVSNVMQALTGKVAGMKITTGNNQPGSTPTINIRGVGSFSAGTSPLYVVDGVPFDGDISSINSQDIESTTVLKDASSAALYGARGANGVILIQTKSGAKAGEKMKVSVDARYGVNSRGVPDYDFMKNPGDYSSKYFEGLYNYFRVKDNDPAAAFQQANEKFGEAIVYVPFEYPAGENLFIQNGNRFSLNPKATLGRMLTDNDGNKYWLQPDNWSDEVFDTNARQEYNVSISGKSKGANYYFSTGYLNDKGYVVGSDFTRYTSRLRSDFKPTDWVKLGANLSYSHYVTNRLENTTEGSNSGNIFAITNFIAPIFPVYVRDGNKQIKQDKFGNTLYDYGTQQYPGLTRPYLSFANPISNYKLDKNEYVADIISAKGYVDFMPAEGLKITFNIGYDVDNTYTLTKNNVFYGQFAENGGIVSRQYSKSTGLNTQQLVTYSKQIQDHSFDILVGHEYFKSEGYSLYGSKQNMYYPNNTEISGAILKPSTSSSLAEYATEGYIGRIQYDYTDKYFASLSFRRDASSRFHPDHRWGNFWSVGASWLLNKEDFMSNINWIDLLKLKISYGLQGNDKIGNFRYMDRYSLKNSNDQLAVSFFAKGNENITWETSKNFNFGLEFNILSGVLSGGFDYFNKEVSDMLFWRPTPTSAGYSGYYDNVGTMTNSGLEFTLNSNIITTENFKWNASLNGSIIKNKLNKLPEEWEAVEDGYRDGSHVYAIGGSIYARAYAHYKGVNEEGKPIWQTFDPKTGKYDVTDDYSVAIEKMNRKVYEDLSADVEGGISTNLEIYNFDFGIGCSYQLGGKLYDGTYAALMHGGTEANSGNNWHKDIANSWTPDNKNTDIPMVNFGGKYANSPSDRFLTSSDYFAINNITLGYTFPKDITDRMKLASLRVYVAADNVVLFSARKGLDPRFNYAVGYNAIRTVSGGIKFTF